MGGGSTKRARGPSRRRSPPPSAGGGSQTEEAAPGIRPETLAAIEAELARRPRIGLTAEQRAAVERFGDQFVARKALADLARIIGAPFISVKNYRQKLRQGSDRADD